MKRLVSCIIIMLMLFSISYAEDYSAMTVDELHNIQDSVRNELLKRDLVASEKTLLFENEGVTIYLTGEHSDFLGDLRLNTITINDTDKEFSIVPELSVNGWDVSCVWDLEANPKKKSKGHIDIKIGGADISTYEELEEIVFRFSYWFENGNHTHAEPLTVQFNTP